ncbi:MAG: protein translocase subunit SecF [Methanobacterium sp.]|uniref:protein translocase subunit SecF n=1 Tax=Methanobacterium sp. TaxID=2164 RepID=UPI003D64CBA1|nr:protein translocase subunit SecF [Methanobacterium sp.]
MKLEKIIESYKPLIAIPIIITLIAVGILAFNGLNQGVDLKGGTITTINLQKPLDQPQIENLVKNGLNITEIKVNSINSTTAALTMGGSVDVIQFTKIMNGTATIASYRSIGPVLSAQALNQVYWALAIAFLFMSITVFIIFRNFVPSMAVILAALSDIIIAAAGMSLFGIPLSLASVGALLLLIGYSVDTDILLTTRVLKRREGTITERALDAMKTGLTMAAAAIGAMAALYIVTVFFIPSAEALSNIAAVLIIGLIADVLATWLMNLGILRWYMESGRR